MGRPKKHKFAVEITDISGEWSTKQLIHLIKDAIRTEKAICDFEEHLVNIQVKNYKKATQHLLSAIKDLSKVCDVVGKQFNIIQPFLSVFIKHAKAIQKAQGEIK